MRCRLSRARRHNSKRLVGEASLGPRPRGGDCTRTLPVMATATCRPARCPAAVKKEDIEEGGGVFEDGDRDDEGDDGGGGGCVVVMLLELHQLSSLQGLQLTGMLREFSQRAAATKNLGHIHQQTQRNSTHSAGPRVLWHSIEKSSVNMHAGSSAIRSRKILG